MQPIRPAGWQKPKGYSDGMVAELGVRGGRIVFVAGQIGWLPGDGDGGRFETDDFVGQARQTFANIVAVLAAAGARPEHIGRLTWYVTDKREFLARQAELGEAYRAVMGRHFPAMAVVQVTALIEERAKVEIEATAVVPQ
ncbi:MAG: RidA family protein [Alphaproteobacteria bacterium]|nr:RidA family protein [Alphaproteobacteria bacterium]